VITLEDILAARERARPVLRPTISLPSGSLSRLAGRSVWLKPEHLQRTGSFKIRGAYNHLCLLEPGVRVVAASAGNHAQGVALGGRLTGHPALIFMPATAALPKVEATRSYGAEVRLVPGGLAESIAAARAVAADGAAHYVPPFDDPDIIAGQGTLGLEVLDEVPLAEAVVIPAGGGGLLAGVAAAVKARRPDLRVIGVEAAGAASLSAALVAGRPVRLDSVATMADGIAVDAVSELTLAHAQAYVDEVVTVSEEEISRAILLLVERAKAVVEPSGAVALAAILAGRVPGRGPAVAVLSGGNVDPLLLIKLIDHGLSAAGRYLVVRVRMPDRPGALAHLAADLADLGLNVLAVEHHRSGFALGVAEVEVAVTVETRNHGHRQQVLAALRQRRYRVEAVDVTPDCEGDSPAV
jgi:threonine dehydratase